MMLHRNPGQNARSAKSISVEVGIQNGTLAIAIASGLTFLNNLTMAIPDAIYALIMFATKRYRRAAARSYS